MHQATLVKVLHRLENLSEDLFYLPRAGPFLVENLEQVAVGCLHNDGPRAKLDVGWQVLLGDHRKHAAFFTYRI